MAGDDTGGTGSGVGPETAPLQPAPREIGPASVAGPLGGLGSETDAATGTAIVPPFTAYRPELGHLMRPAKKTFPAHGNRLICGILPAKQCNKFIAS